MNDDTDAWGGTDGGEVAALPVPLELHLLTIEEVATNLRIARSEVYAKLINTGLLPTIKIDEGGRRRLVRATDLKEWIESQPVADVG
ncbi:helix-turn-helix domain-containing protein [Aquihabitans daechungensis]|uniref:helix-turn-helix domain-containing protein n=1 Tax=Aquihabitans daechungensis TaxID=1052257 RepID=UPI003BA202A8